MKRSRFIGEQLIGGLRQAEAGVSFSICVVRMVFLMRPFTSDAASWVGCTFLTQAAALVGRRKLLLKRLVGEQILDVVILKNVISKTFEGRSQQKSRAAYSYWA